MRQTKDRSKVVRRKYSAQARTSWLVRTQRIECLCFAPTYLPTHLVEDGPHGALLADHGQHLGDEAVGDQEVRLGRDGGWTSITTTDGEVMMGAL